MTTEGMNKETLERARGHLGSAIMQSIPADDQIIMDHVRAAYELLGALQDAERAKEHAA